MEKSRFDEERIIHIIQEADAVVARVSVPSTRISTNDEDPRIA